MEYGMPVHWGCMAAASFILSCMTMVSWDQQAAARIYARLVRTAVEYSAGIAPMAALVYTLYLVNGRL